MKAFEPGNLLKINNVGMILGNDTLAPHPNRGAMAPLFRQPCAKLQWVNYQISKNDEILKSGFKKSKREFKHIYYICKENGFGKDNQNLSDSLVVWI